MSIPRPANAPGVPLLMATCRICSVPIRHEPGEMKVCLTCDRNMRRLAAVNMTRSWVDHLVAQMGDAK